jgi:hypothetical protein
MAKYITACICGEVVGVVTRFEQKDGLGKGDCQRPKRVRVGKSEPNNLKVCIQICGIEDAVYI